MTRTLILTRHAKSSWGDASLPDHSRPLNTRGKASAQAIGAWLKAQDHIPDQVLSSSSQRTRETWELMNLEADAAYADALYHASSQQMMDVLCDASGNVVLMLGHNPGIADFARRLVRTSPAHPRYGDYPTCATAVIEFDISDWGSLQWHSGRVLNFVLPRELLE
ncbi:histidine phosphatase family protein [Phaeobacter sp. NW0010-22]|uniref:SixA phosphatase family protein n=1 Tax=Phaeobacter sp. NW0010-22 TaxID=3135907 RepID=UPI00310A96F4